MGFSYLLCSVMGTRFVCTFDKDGSFVGVHDVPRDIADVYDVRSTDTPPPDYDVNTIVKEIDLEERPITIKRFFVDQYGIGIRDFPEVFMKALLRPTEHTSDDVDIANAELNRWFKDGLFELRLGPEFEFWLDGSGEVEST